MYNNITSKRYTFISLYNKASFGNTDNTDLINYIIRIALRVLITIRSNTSDKDTTKNEMAELSNLIQYLKNKPFNEHFRLESELILRFLDFEDAETSEKRNVVEDDIVKLPNKNKVKREKKERDKEIIKFNRRQINNSPHLQNRHNSPRGGDIKELDLNGIDLYYAKYMKYKQKYIDLKNQLAFVYK